MDRKAASFYAVAATASLGVLLSAGCGAESATPARMAQRETHASAPAPVVVVSPEPTFFEADRPLQGATTPTNEAVVAVESLVDPYAETAPAAEMASETPAAEVAVQEVSPAPAEGAAEVAAVEAEAIELASEIPQPAPAASKVELRFAEGATAPETSDAEKTISVEVGPQGKSAPRKPIASRFADAGDRKTLQPLVVTPRQMPGQPSPAEMAKAEPQATEPEPEANLPEPAAKAVEPVKIVATPAKVVDKPAETLPPAEPVVSSKLVPAPLTVAAAQPQTEPSQASAAAAQPEPLEPQIEVAKPAEPAEQVAIAEPRAAEPLAVESKPAQPEVVKPASESKPPVLQQQVAKAAPVEPAPESTAPQATAKVQKAAEPEPVAPSPSTLRMAEVQVAKAPEPQPAPAVAAAKQADPVAAKPAEAVVAKSDPKPAAPGASVAAAPAPVQTAPTPVQQPVAKNQPQPVVPAPTPVVAQAAPPSVPSQAQQPAAVQAPANQPVAVQPAPAPSVAMQPAAQPAAAQPTPAQPQPVATAPALPTAPVRSPALVASMAQADERVRHAIQLAEKGALYASRKEFTSALSLISQARDVEFGTRQYSQATAAGLLALKEANDFVKPGAATANLSRIVAGHKTPILKGLDVSDLPPALAAQHYYDYAKVQLSTGIGRETVGSIALYGLGRIIVAGAGANGQQMEYTGPAMALYQAALICEPQNFRAAHELGVLLASTGQLELARNMLLGSASASPQPMMWKNLAVVHARLGEAQLAAEAQQKATVLEQTSPSANTPAVQWVDPATFAQIGSASDPTLPPSTATPATASPAEAVPAKKPSNVARSRSQWDPLNLRR